MRGSPTHGDSVLKAGDNVTLVVRGEFVRAHIAKVLDAGDAVALIPAHGGAHQIINEVNEGRTWARGTGADARAMLLLVRSSAT